MNNREQRCFTLDELKIETRDDGKRMIRGHAAVFNSMSENLGGFREMIAPGAFSDAIKSDDVRLLINHEGLPLARTASGTLKLSEDERGLLMEADLDETDPDVQRLIPKMTRGDLNSMSFAFSVRKDGQRWGKSEDGMSIRTLTSLRLFDVSVVTYPAYTATDVAVRSMTEWTKETQPEKDPAQSVKMLRRRLDLIA